MYGEKNFSADCNAHQLVLFFLCCETSVQNFRFLKQYLEVAQWPQILSFDKYTRHIYQVNYFVNL